MPQLAQQPILPGLPHTNDPDQLFQWANGFQKAFRRLWTEMLYTLNSLCRVDTLANRTSSPALNETFWITSDTSQLWGGVSGAWTNVGPRRGLASITNGASSVTVSLSPVEPDASYIVTGTATYSTTVYAVEASKATNQFVLSFGTAAGATDKVNWVLWRA